MTARFIVNSIRCFPVRRKSPISFRRPWTIAVLPSWAGAGCFFLPITAQVGAEWYGRCCALCGGACAERGERETKKLNNHFIKGVFAGYTASIR